MWKTNGLVYGNFAPIIRNKTRILFQLCFACIQNPCIYAL